MVPASHGNCRLCYPVNPAPNDAVHGFVVVLYVVQEFHSYLVPALRVVHNGNLTARQRAVNRKERAAPTKERLCAPGILLILFC